MGNFFTKVKRSDNSLQKADSTKNMGLPQLLSGNKLLKKVKTREKLKKCILSYMYV